MALTKDQKAAAVAELEEQLDAVNTVYLTDFAGLTVEKANKLRREFRKAEVDFRVVKNTLLKRAMEAKGGYDGLYEFLEGPTAIAMTTDPARPAKVLKEFLKDSELPKFKAAFVDGAFFSGDQLDTLASLKSKEELVGDIIGLLLSPITNVVGGLQAQGSNLVGAIKTIAEKEEA
jgi:large subunit ribosomal protein L10